MVLRHAHVFLFGLLFSVIVISGCLETSNDNFVSPRDENRAWTSTPIPVSTYQSIAGDNENTPSIQNINGQYNTVYYLRGTNPLKKENGQGNVIKTY